MFTANIRLKANALPYLNRNIYIHREGTDLWANGQINGQMVNDKMVNSLMVSFYSDQPALDLLTPVRGSQIADLQGGNYETFKAQKAEECIRLAEQRLPALRGAIDKVYTSSPLTYQRYTHTAEGSAYGIRKDWRSPLTTVLTPKTPIENVLLTGQNLNLHGVLGVSMTSVITSAQLIGMDSIVNEINRQ
jgi:all-trans-retinol 13,14-reductase